MKRNIIAISAITFSLLAAGPAFANWTVIKNDAFVGGGYKVLDKDTGRELNTRFKSKKGAKAAAKLMNTADDLAEDNKNS